MTDKPVIRLEESFLCGDLDRGGPHISNDPRRCPICHSQVVSLAKILNRTEGDKRNG